jgi:perosamine synthetase
VFAQISNWKIPVAKPSIGPLELQYATEAISSSWISSRGPFIKSVEQQFESIFDAKHAIFVSNGTVALHLALIALDIARGDEVICPTLTYIAPINAITYVGATPVFVDCNSSDWCLDAQLVEDAITSRTKAIMVVHSYGQVANMEALLAISLRHGIPIIEDSAETIFGAYNGQMTGTMGVMGTFSFFGNKVLTSGEGGLVITNDEELASKVRLYMNQGASQSKKYLHEVIGYNYRGTNVQAAILQAQLERRNEIMDARWKIYRRYEERLRNIEGIQLQEELLSRRRSPWLFCLLIAQRAGTNMRDALSIHLEQIGIETRPFFYPIHKLSPYVHLEIQDGHLAKSLKLADMGMNLPTYFDLTSNQVDQICTSIVDFLI